MCFIAVAYAQIDWHDFVVVETVDFQPNEPGNFPPPTTPEEVGARLLAQERFESNPIRVSATSWCNPAFVSKQHDLPHSQLRSHRRAFSLRNSLVSSACFHLCGTLYSSELLTRRNTLRFCQLLL